MTFRTIVTTREETHKLAVFLQSGCNQRRRLNGLVHLAQLTHAQIMPGQNRWSVVLGFDGTEEFCDGRDSDN